MTSKELKHLNRAELLQMLLTLAEENEKLKQRNEVLCKALKDRTIQLENVGSIAEAALQINHVFEDAEAAAQQYLQNIKALSDRQTALYQEACDAAQRKAALIIAEAEATKEASIREANAYWNHVRAKIRETMNQLPDDYRHRMKGNTDS